HEVDEAVQERHGVAPPGHVEQGAPPGIVRHVDDIDARYLPACVTLYLPGVHRPGEQLPQRLYGPAQPRLGAVRPDTVRRHRQPVPFGTERRVIDESETQARIPLWEAESGSRAEQFADKRGDRLRSPYAGLGGDGVVPVAGRVPGRAGQELG